MFEIFKRLAPEKNGHTGIEKAGKVAIGSIAVAGAVYLARRIPRHMLEMNYGKPDLAPSNLPEDNFDTAENEAGSELERSIIISEIAASDEYSN